MIRDADIQRLIADEDTPRHAERPDWLDAVFDGSLMSPTVHVPSRLWIGAATVVASVCFAALAGLVIWAVSR